MAKTGSLAQQVRQAGAAALDELHRTQPASVSPPPSACPEVDEFYMRAFAELSTDRDYGMGVGPIPASEIRAWAKDAGLDRGAQRTFMFVLGKLDAAYLQAKADEERKERPPS